MIQFIDASGKLSHQQSLGVAFIGSGSAQLTTVLSNDQLAAVVDTSDEWIATRTGIRQRHIAAAT